MYVNVDPIPIDAQDPNAEFIYCQQLKELVFALQSVSLTSRDGVIQNNDKAGNISANYIVYTSNGVANTEDPVPHVLGKVPNGYIVVEQDKAAVLYDGTTAWSTSLIYLKSNVASVTWKVMVF